MQCAVCHAPLETDARFCSSCGSPAASTAATGPTQRLDQQSTQPRATTLRGGLCPQCGSNAVFVKTNAMVEQQQGHAVKIRIAEPVNIFGEAMRASINIFVCAGCGYMELYLVGDTALEEVKRTWHPALSVEPEA